jgi:predicted dehydrogenase
VTSRLDYLRPAIAATHGDDRLRVIGTDGFIEVNEGDPAITLAGRNGIEMIPFGETENLFVEFIRNLRSGTSSRITADDCFYITDVVLRARQAADEANLLELPAYRPVRTPVAPG